MSPNDVLRFGDIPREFTDEVRNADGTVPHVLLVRLRRDGDHVAVGELCLAQRHPQLLLHLFHRLLPLVLWQQVDLVDDDEHGVARDLPDDETLGRLRLDALRDVHHQHHEIDYLWFNK